MIAIILAGGYAKRLWPLTLNTPKALLPLAGKPVIDYVIEKIFNVSPPVEKIIVSTNLKFQRQFEMWLEAKRYSNVELLPDASTGESEKIGAVMALHNITSNFNSDFLVVAGDSLFIDDLYGLIQFFKEKQSPVVALYQTKDLDEAKKGATAILNEEGRIVEFIEKPINPKTTLAGACLYIFPSRIKTKLREYVNLGMPRDEPGHFIQWLHKGEPVYGCMLKNHFWDIGTLKSYREANAYLKALKGE
ncbi:MAG: nucleotidyltransferase family protein [Candidatus Bathyarchaeia archaeon]